MSAGTGGWHEGEEMNPPAARQIRLRGGSVDGFSARKLTSAHLTGADLILTATADQSDYVHALVPGATGRTFVLGHLGRLLREIDADALPPAGTDSTAFGARAGALVEAADRGRAGSEPLPTDDLDDPWGRGDQTFQRIADDIDESLYALVDVLLPGAPRPACDTNSARTCRRAPPRATDRPGEAGVTIVAPDADGLRRAVEVLQQESVVAFPTETVYGLGANAFSAKAVAEIYRLKNRPSWNPLIVHVATVEQARALARHWPAAADKLASRFWPGPLTLIVSRLTAPGGLIAPGGQSGSDHQEQSAGSARAFPLRPSPGWPARRRPCCARGGSSRKSPSRTGRPAWQPRRRADAGPGS